MKKLINLKKLINIRNLIIVILCLTIISLGIGFAILSIELEERSDENLIFDVSITDVKQNTSIKGGINSPIAKHLISQNEKTLTTQINMYAPYDELSYTITIENRGTITAEIIDLIENPDYLKDNNAKISIAPIEISHLDIIGEVLKPGEKTELKIVASYKPTLTVVPKAFTYKITVVAESLSKEE